MSNHTLPSPGVIDSVDEATRIHDTTRADGRAGAGERAVPYHCPYCAEEDLRPLGATPGAWHCRTCTRTFSVKYLGMQAPTPSWPPTPATTAAPTPTGGTR
jgi:ribosomal protein L37AE/L43A